MRSAVGGGRRRLALGLLLRPLVRGGGRRRVRRPAALRRRRRRRAVGGRAPRALGLAVVVVVEARALEVDGDRVEDPADRRLAGLTRCDRIVGHALHHLELVPVVAAVFVDRHRFTEYRNGPMTDVTTMDTIVALAKRRGFVFPTSEIYGGL